MPRFFFDFSQAGDFTADAVGIQLADSEESYLEAIKAAQEMWSELLKERRDPRRCRFEVRSEGGDVLFCIPFQEVLDCCAQPQRVSRATLFADICSTRDYAGRVTTELRKEIETCRQVMSQARTLLAKTDGVVNGVFAAPQED